MATFGNFLQILATFGNFWQFLATFGNFWQLLANFDIFWQLLATCGNFWLIFANLQHFLLQILASCCNFWLILATLQHLFVANFGFLLQLLIASRRRLGQHNITAWAPKARRPLSYTYARRSSISFFYSLYFLVSKCSLGVCVLCVPCGSSKATLRCYTSICDGIIVVWSVPQVISRVCFYCFTINLTQCLSPKSVKSDVVPNYIFLHQI